MSQHGPEPAGVAIILLTMNQRDKTLRCLASLAQVSTPSHRVVLWDNGSVDGTAAAVAERFPDVMVHHHPTNAGVASGRNQAARIAFESLAPDYLLFLDNDMTVAPDFLDPLVATFDSDDGLAQTTGKIRDLDAPEKLYGAGGCRIRFWMGDTRHRGYGEPDRGQYDRPVECVASGGCMMVRSDLFRELNGFDAAFDPYGPEDLDFGLRAKQAGYRGLYVPEAVVYHETRPGRTFEGGDYSQTYAKHRARHWFMFMSRHASTTQKLGFFLIGAPYLMVVLMIREARKGNLKNALKGLFGGRSIFSGAVRAPVEAEAWDSSDS